MGWFRDTPMTGNLHIRGWTMINRQTSQMSEKMGMLSHQQLAIFNASRLTGA